MITRFFDAIEVAFVTDRCDIELFVATVELQVHRQRKRIIGKTCA